MLLEDIGSNFDRLEQDKWPVCKKNPSERTVFIKLITLENSMCTTYIMQAVSFCALLYLLCMYMAAQGLLDH